MASATLLDGQGLLRDIIANPGDDTLRLVYADWLEESGDADDPQYLSRADFIRGYVLWERSGYDPAHPFAAQHRKANNLMNWPDVPGVGLCCNSIHPDEAADVPLAHAHWRRGFVESVRLPLAAWQQHGPALVRQHPITRVELSDREPSQGGEELFGFWRRDEGDDFDPDDLPPALWDVLKSLRKHRLEICADSESYIWFASSVIAHDALSAACLVWARLVTPPPPASG